MGRKIYKANVQQNSIKRFRLMLVWWVTDGIVDSARRNAVKKIPFLASLL